MHWLLGEQCKLRVLWRMGSLSSCEAICCKQEQHRVLLFAVAVQPQLGTHLSSTRRGGCQRDPESLCSNTHLCYGSLLGISSTWGGGACLHMQAVQFALKWAAAAETVVSAFVYG